MLEAILSTLKIIGWLGIVLAILSIVNIVTGTLVNLWKNHEDFNTKKMFKGILKVLVFFVSSAAIAIAFTILPFINNMITETFNVVLLSNELLNTLSSVGVLGVVVSAVVVQGKKAIQGILDLSKISGNDPEEITWEVKENE